MIIDTERLPEKVKTDMENGFHLVCNADSLPRFKHVKGRIYKMHFGYPDYVFAEEALEKGEYTREINLDDFNQHEIEMSISIDYESYQQLYDKYKTGPERDFEIARCIFDADSSIIA